VSTRRDTALVARLSGYASAVEVGVGRRYDVAVGLVDAGVSVTATDIVDRDVPPEVEFVRDDIVTASERAEPGGVYEAELIYGLNLPPELHRPTLEVARAVDAEFLFTTLGGDPPVVPCDVESVADGETVYVARGNGRSSDP
jgi:uncharacterized UPF0146 family protein